MRAFRLLLATSLPHDGRRRRSRSVPAAPSTARSKRAARPSAAPVSKATPISSLSQGESGKGAIAYQDGADAPTFVVLNGALMKTGALGNWLHASLPTEPALTLFMRWATVFPVSRAASRNRFLRLPMCERLREGA